MGTVVVGILFFDGPATFARLTLLAVIAGAIIGLKLVDGHYVQAQEA